MSPASEIYTEPLPQNACINNSTVKKENISSSFQEVIEKIGVIVTETAIDSEANYSTIPETNDYSYTFDSNLGPYLDTTTHNNSCSPSTSMQPETNVNYSYTFDSNLGPYSDTSTHNNTCSPSTSMQSETNSYYISTVGSNLSSSRYDNISSTSRQSESFTNDCKNDFASNTMEHQNDFTSPIKINVPLPKRERKYNCALKLQFFKPNCLLTVPMIYKLCSPYGKLLKIHIIKQSNPTVHVEYCSSIFATKATYALIEQKPTLCKKLSISYFDEANISVESNDMFSWDVNLKNANKWVEEDEMCVMIVKCRALPKLNPQKLFNLFCIYGNIIKIQYTKNENIALVQMETKSHVERTIQYLRCSKIYGSYLILNIGKRRQTIKPFPSEYCMGNGSSKEKNFGPDIRRFIPGICGDRTCKPSNTLRLNVNIEVTQEFIFNVMMNTLGHIDILVDAKTKYLLTLTFKSIDHATEALLICNNMGVVDPNTSQQFYLNLRYYEI
jgi:hypothetical protein